MMIITTPLFVCQECKLEFAHEWDFNKHMEIEKQKEELFEDIKLVERKIINDTIYLNKLRTKLQNLINSDVNEDVDYEFIYTFQCEPSNVCKEELEDRKKEESENKKTAVPARGHDEYTKTTRLLSNATKNFDNNTSLNEFASKNNNFHTNSCMNPRMNSHITS